MADDYDEEVGVEVGLKEGVGLNMGVGVGGVGVMTSDPSKAGDRRAGGASGAGDARRSTHGQGLGAQGQGLGAQGQGLGAQGQGLGAPTVQGRAMWLLGGTGGADVLSTSPAVTPWWASSQYLGGERGGVLGGVGSRGRQPTSRGGWLGAADGIIREYALAEVIPTLTQP